MYPRITRWMLHILFVYCILCFYRLLWEEGDYVKCFMGVLLCAVRNLKVKLWPLVVHLAAPVFLRLVKPCFMYMPWCCFADYILWAYDSLSRKKSCGVCKMYMKHRHNFICVHLCQGCVSPNSSAGILQCILYLKYLPNCLMKRNQGPGAALQWMNEKSGTCTCVLLCEF